VCDIFFSNRQGDLAVMMPGFVFLAMGGGHDGLYLEKRVDGFLVGGYVSAQLCCFLLFGQWSTSVAL